MDPPHHPRQACIHCAGVPNWLTRVPSPQSRKILNTNNLNSQFRDWTGRSGRVLSGRLHALGCPGCPVWSAPLRLRTFIAACNCSQLEIKPAKNPQLHKHKGCCFGCSPAAPGSHTRIQFQSTSDSSAFLIFRQKWWRYPAICVAGFLQALLSLVLPGIIQFWSRIHRENDSRLGAICFDCEADLPAVLIKHLVCKLLSL